MSRKILNPCLPKCGSPGFFAPEIFSPEKKVGRKADVFSLGVIFYILICHDLPWIYEDDWDDLMKLNEKGSIEIFENELDNLSKKGFQLLQKMLQTDPKHRIKTS